MNGIPLLEAITQLLFSNVNPKELLDTIVLQPISLLWLCIQFEFKRLKS